MLLLDAAGGLILSSKKILTLEYDCYNNLSKIFTDWLRETLNIFAFHQLQNDFYHKKV